MKCFNAKTQGRRVSQKKNFCFLSACLCVLRASAFIPTQPSNLTMGKPTGFLDFKRELPADRTAGSRVADWKEFHEHMPEADLKKQGARCMDCGIPFCHTGQLVSGMASGCPIS